jgi:hypothetical protein
MNDNLNGQAIVAPHNNVSLQELQQRTVAALGSCIALLPQGFNACVIFAHPLMPSNNIVITGMPIDGAFRVLAAEIKRSGQPLPSLDGIQAPQPEGTINPEQEAVAAMVAMTTAIRRAIPFITGPGADTAKKLLVEALGKPAAEGKANPAAYVVSTIAGFMATLVEDEPQVLAEMFARVAAGTTLMRIVETPVQLGDKGNRIQ